mgnify:CR=1 FL=1
MPVRSSGSSLLRWPDREEVHAAVVRWAQDLAESRSELLRAGYFGSYARGDWGVGSDVDLVILVQRSDDPPFRRAANWPAERLPVPADVFVYTPEEWAAMDPDRGFARELRETTRWVFVREPEVPMDRSPTGM